MSLDSVVARLEAVAARLEAAAGRGGGGGGASGGDGNSSPSVDAFDTFMSGEFKAFVDKSAAVGGDVATVATTVNEAFQAMRDFLVIVSQSKKPSDATFQSMLAAMSAKIADVQTFKDKNSRGKQGNHLAAVAEGVPCLAWVTMVPKPCPYIKEMNAAAQFWTNKVLKEFNNTDGGAPHVEWARSWVAAIAALEAYVKDFHTTGPSWNPAGGDAASASTKPASPSKQAAAPAPAAAAAAAPAADGAVKSGLFSELSKGGAITSGLKKVDKSQMTHKNPELRATSKVPAEIGGSSVSSLKSKFGGAAAAPAAAKEAPVKPPVLVLSGKKWDCSYQVGNKNIMINAEGATQTLYVFKCTDSVIQVKGKLNAITLDSCKKTSIVFEDCVAAFEVINSQGVQCQTTGKVQTISIDKSDGAQIFLSVASIGASIVTAKSSELNISVPDVDKPNADMIEVPVPEQFLSKWDPKTKKLVTTINESV